MKYHHYHHRNHQKNPTNQTATKINLNKLATTNKRKEHGKEIVALKWSEAGHEEVERARRRQSLKELVYSVAGAQTAVRIRGATASGWR